MEYNLLENLEYCGAIVDELSTMLLYTHLLPATVSLIMGGYILYRKRDSISWKLFGVSLVFTLWCLTNLIIWFSYDQSAVMMFAWSIIGLLSSLLFLFIFNFIFSFVTGRKLPVFVAITEVALLLPVLIATPTEWNLAGFDIRDCVAIEGLWFTNYFQALGFITAAAIITVPFLRRRPHYNAPTSGAVTLLIIGAELFIVSFLITGILASYLVEKGLIPDFGLEQYGIVIMAVFMSFLGYITVKYRAFNIKLLGTQALVGALILLIAAEYLFAENQTSYLLITSTLLLAVFFGLSLIKSVNQEVRQRERIEMMALDLEKANTRLRELDKMKTEFVSIASHQLRAPLAAIKGYASMLLEESFGKMTVGIREAVGKIFSSSALMARSVDDFLNVSRIELGQMRYDLGNFDLCDLIKIVIAEQKPIAEDKKLTLTFKQDPSITTCDVFADMGKVKQILTNLIDNAIKYTPKGSVVVTFSRDEARGLARIAIRDTGMGMSQATIKKLFDKFVRADNANKVNVIGTGLGLYVVKQFAEAHGGRILVESLGEGEGATFTVELPLKPKEGAAALGQSGTFKKA